MQSVQTLIPSSFCKTVSVRVHGIFTGFLTNLWLSKRVVWTSPLAYPDTIVFGMVGCHTSVVRDEASTNCFTGFHVDVEKTNKTPSPLPLARNLPSGENFRAVIPFV
jgi:hypothetical protein